MLIRKIFLKVLICVLCVLCLHCSSFAAGNLPYGDIGDYGNWITESNMEKVNNNLYDGATSFQNQFQENVNSTDFVPIEVKLGVVFMKALSSLDYLLKTTLVRFTILFLLVMYAFWVALEAYKIIRESTDYKQVLYDLFKKGFTIIVWIIVLEIGPAKLFSAIITPIVALGTYLSNFILNTVAQTYDVDIPLKTCDAIHQYVNANDTSKMLINADAAANIMCLPGRLSIFFYHAVGAAWKWMMGGFGHSATAVVVGGVCVIMFVKCIFKYAFMTLGVVADLFLTLLMLPFTAIAESMPATSEKNYVGQIFSGFLKIFNTKKLSDIISVFINATIYFVSLSIVIGICAALLTNIVFNTYDVSSAMIALLCGSLVLYLADKTDELAKQIGGSIDNSFGEQLQKDTKTLWGKTKDFGSMVYKDWVKKK